MLKSRRPRPIPLVAAATLLLVGCNASLHERPGRAHVVADVHADGTVEDGRPTLGTPIRIPGTPTFLVPYTVERPERFFERQRPSSIAGSSAASPRYQPTNWHNVFFRNFEDETTTPLLTDADTPGLITGYTFALNDGDPAGVDFILWQVVEVDRDRNGRLSAADGVALYATRPDGRERIRISPAGVAATQAAYHRDLGLLTFRGLSDDNGDGKLTTADAPRPYFWRDQPPSTGEPFVTPEFLPRQK